MTLPAFVESFRTSVTERYNKALLKVKVHIPSNFFNTATFITLVGIIAIVSANLLRNNTGFVPIDMHTMHVFYLRILAMSLLSGLFISSTIFIITTLINLFWIFIKFRPFIKFQILIASWWGLIILVSSILFLFALKNIHALTGLNLFTYFG